MFDLVGGQYIFVSEKVSVFQCFRGHKKVLLSCVGFCRFRRYLVLSDVAVEKYFLNCTPTCSVAMLLIVL